MQHHTWRHRLGRHGPDGGYYRSPGEDSGQENRGPDSLRRMTDSSCPCCTPFPSSFSTPPPPPDPHVPSRDQWTGEGSSYLTVLVPDSPGSSKQTTVSSLDPLTISRRGSRTVLISRNPSSRPSISTVTRYPLDRVSGGILEVTGNSSSSGCSRSGQGDSGDRGRSRRETPESWSTVRSGSDHSMNRIRKGRHMRNVQELYKHDQRTWRTGTVKTHERIGE